MQTPILRVFYFDSEQIRLKMRLGEDFSLAVLAAVGPPSQTDPGASVSAQGALGKGFNAPSCAHPNHHNDHATPAQPIPTLLPPPGSDDAAPTCTAQLYPLLSLELRPILSCFLLFTKTATKCSSRSALLVMCPCRRCALCLMSHRVLRSRVPKVSHQERDIPSCHSLQRTTTTTPSAPSVHSTVDPVHEFFPLINNPEFDTSRKFCMGPPKLIVNCATVPVRLGNLQ
jgi:hypothetical protein